MYFFCDWEEADRRPPTILVYTLSIVTGSDISHKNGGVGKIGGVVLKKGRCHLFSY